jgi:hypothetical protein
MYVERSAPGRVSLISKRLLKRILFPLFAFVPLAYFLPGLSIFYTLCGIYDVTRNQRLNGALLQRYFLGNGLLTWLLSPFNILMDLLALPHINKGVYRLEDLPAAWQGEVKRLIEVALKANLVAQLGEMTQQFPRTMVFFKWYGHNVKAFLDVPEFHRDWRYVQTIGVSVFNKKVSTSQHFGFLRASLRVLYNLNDVTERSASIVVGDETNFWCESKLFVFDDTLMHQSLNQTNQIRYCLFVDIVRPTPLPRLIAFVIRCIGILSRSFSSMFYRNWKVFESKDRQDLYRTKFPLIF